MLIVIVDLLKLYIVAPCLGFCFGRWCFDFAVCYIVVFGLLCFGYSLLVSCWFGLWTNCLCAARCFVFRLLTLRIVLVLVIWLCGLLVALGYYVIYFAVDSFVAVRDAWFL